MDKMQRLLLSNQFKILSKIDPENKDYYLEALDIVENGYKIFYSSFLEHLDDEMSEETGEFVLDVLDLYYAVELYKSSGGDLNGLRETTFSGFDGNKETGHMAFTRFLIEKQNKFAELAKLKSKTDNYNSHRPMISTYTKLVEKWKKIMDDGAWPETKEQFEQIFEKDI